MNLLPAVARCSMLAIAVAASAAFAVSPPVPDLQGELAQAVPVGNPYRPVLAGFFEIDARLKDVKPSDARPPEVDEALRAVAAQLMTVDASAEGARDWRIVRDPKDPGDPLSATVPESGLVRRMARDLATLSKSFPPDEAIRLNSALLRFSENYSAGGTTLIQKLVGAVTQRATIDAIAARLSSLQPADAAALLVTLDAVSNEERVEQALRAEFENFFLPFLERLRDAALAEQAQRAAVAAGVDPEALPAFAARLRLSSYIQFPGGDYLIGFEDAQGGGAFQLGPGKAHDGIAIVDMNFAAQTAVIEKDGARAVLKLESREIVVERRRGADFLAVLKPLMVNLQPVTEEERALDQLLNNFLNHPRGPEGYFQSVVAEYEQRMQAAAASARASQFSKEEFPPKDAFLQLALPSFSAVGRTLQALQVREALLRDAIRMRHQGGSGPSQDPWSSDGATFVHEALPDGGFRLKSAYEQREGQPVVLEFR